jgi:predicted nucleotidyltransferase
MKTEKDFEELLKLFNKNKVRYCIIGSYAVAFHAEPRYTKDMDIFVAPDRNNAQRIIKSLNEFGFRSLSLEEKDLIQKGKIIQLGYEPVRIDLMTSIDGCGFKEVWAGRAIGIYGKQKAIFIGLNELIKNKKESGRKQDEVDISILKSRKKKAL